MGVLVQTSPWNMMASLNLYSIHGPKRSVASTCYFVVPVARFAISFNARQIAKMVSFVYCFLKSMISI